MLGPGAAAPEIDGANINPASPVNHFTLSAINGKVIVAIFFAYWCSTCQLELTTLQSLWKTYMGLKVEFIAVHIEWDNARAVNDGYASVEDAAKDKISHIGVQFPVIQDSTWQYFDPYRESDLNIPQVYVITPDHHIQASFEGAEASTATYNSIIDALNPRDPIDVEMVMDVSDTMNDFTSAGISKLAAMKQASKMIVDFSSDHWLTSDRMGLVWFTDDVSSYPAGNTLLPIKTNITVLKNQIDAKTTGICTAMGAGLQTAFDILHPSTQRRYAILLTDGMQNIDPMVQPVGSHFEIIDAPTQTGCTQIHSSVQPHPGTNITSWDTKVHTIGVGITAAYSSLLSDVAAATGGTYLATTDPANDLSLLYFVDLCTCMAGASPAVVYHNTGTFSPEQCQSIDRFLINKSIRKFTAMLSWPESCAGNMAFWLRAPDGTVVDLHSMMKTFDTYAMATVPLPVEQDGRQLPHAGEWQMIVRGETGSAAPYTAMVIGEDTETHFGIVSPHKVYEVGDILPLHIWVKEARNYLTNPSEIILQKKTMRVPLSEMLVQYQFPPAMVTTTTGTTARIPGTARLESKLKALATDPRFTEQLKPNVTTQSLREGTLPCTIAQNEMTFPITLTEPGVHTFRVNIRFDLPKNGPISRVSLVSVYVGPGAADPKQSAITMIPVGSGKIKGLTMLITPKNAAGQRIGPGRKDDIGLLIGKKKPRYSIEDLLDGTYRVTIEPGKTGFEKSQPVTLFHKDKIFWKGKTETLQ